MDSSIQQRIAKSRVLTGNDEPVQMNVSTLMGAFSLVIIGWIIAFVAFLFEIIFFYAAKKVKSRVK